MGRVTEFKYGKNLGDVIRKNNNQRLKYLSNFGQPWAMMNEFDAFVFIDNHDNQRGLFIFVFLFLCWRLCQAVYIIYVTSGR